MATIIVAAVLIFIVSLIIRSMVKTKKAGKSVICGGNCSGCHGACSYHGSSTTQKSK
ncbi:MAG: FeoB-associated Cys-rich membrane protein [Clostridia bacterium]|nr:FeoB-associated Cys-rich membrane protein [Clostridia bacterium]NCC43228.1 FeoB-associated Cys-rich membrane protein [Clostridia bacterium]